MSLSTPVQNEKEAKLEEWRQRAAPVLEADDPLTLVEEALGATYGGDTRPAILIYLAMTSRLLGMRDGAMPAHLLLVGQTSVGKSYMVNAVLRLFPKAAYVVVRAGSSRVLIYGEEDLQHRALIIGEADSLPSSEDNPAASAIRNLLQDHQLSYDVTDWVRKKNGEGKKRAVRHIERPGPTVLIITSTRRPRPQMDSRLFSIDAPDDQGQVRAALGVQAKLELEDAPARPKDLIAFQRILQVSAPWDVVVPFADKLAEAVGRSPEAPRVLRDFARLVALIKATAIIRHKHRHKNSNGRLEATLDDYRVVYGLIREVYTSSVTGASKRVREVVGAVAVLQRGAGRKPITETLVARHLKTHKMMVSRNVNKALEGGWLVNRDPRPRRFDLRVGGQLPDEGGLPRPEALGV